MKLGPSGFEKSCICSKEWLASVQTLCWYFPKQLLSQSELNCAFWCVSDTASQNSAHNFTSVHSTQNLEVCKRLHKKNVPKPSDLFPLCKQMVKLKHQNSSNLSWKFKKGNHSQARRACYSWEFAGCIIFCSLFCGWGFPVFIRIFLLFNGFRCWYGWAFSNSLMQINSRKNKNVSRSIPQTRASTWLLVFFCVEKRRAFLVCKTDSRNNWNDKLCTTWWQKPYPLRAMLWITWGLFSLKAHSSASRTLLRVYQCATDPQVGVQHCKLTPTWQNGFFEIRENQIVDGFWILHLRLQDSIWPLLHDARHKDFGAPWSYTSFWVTQKSHW